MQLLYYDVVGKKREPDRLSVTDPKYNFIILFYIIILFIILFYIIILFIILYVQKLITKMYLLCLI